MKSTEQLDLIRHSDAQLAAAYRVAAEHALLNPYESMAARERRAATYRAEAERYEQGRRG